MQGVLPEGERGGAGSATGSARSRGGLPQGDGGAGRRIAERACAGARKTARRARAYTQEGIRLPGTHRGATACITARSPMRGGLPEHKEGTIAFQRKPTRYRPRDTSTSTSTNGRGTKSELATSPLPSRGPKSGRKCYATLAFSGVPNRRGTKSELATSPLPSQGAKKGQKCYAISVFLGVPKRGDKHGPLQATEKRPLGAVLKCGP